jgi:hypothetical protein
MSYRCIMTAVRIAALISLLCLVAFPSKAEWVFRDRKLYLNEEGSSYLKLTFLSQVWMRQLEYNPGTTVFGAPKDRGFDIGIRRYRMQVYAQITPRAFIYTQFGENNFNVLSDRKAGFFVHDVTGEYAFLPDKLTIGAGLTGWSGISRFSSPAVGTALGIDVPLFQQYTNDVTDQFLRKLSIYAKGQLGKIDYRLIMSHPMAVQKSSSPQQGIGPNATFSSLPPKMQWHGYLKYQFFDQESNVLPYQTGTYLGDKKVLCIGLGALFQPNAMWSTTNRGDTTFSPLAIISTDVYYDAPVGNKGAAVSVYTGYSYSSFGERYLRNLAVMNPANGDSDPTVLNGGGNAFPDYGTGSTIYLQAGYKFRDNLIHTATLMPYVSLQCSQYDRLQQTMFFVDSGLSCLLSGHLAKVTLSYQNRPVFNSEGFIRDRKAALTMQMQINFN